MHESLNRMLTERVVAVLRASTAAELREVAAAMLQGGIQCIEFTMTSPGALEMIRDVSGESGEAMLLGAGTVLDGETARAALLAGARFLVSPALKPDVIAVGKRYGVPVIPGAFTPSEVLAAWEAGADLVKLFPAGHLGPGYLRDLRGPYPQIPLMPSGGLTVDDAAEYLRAGAAVASVGGELTRRGPGESTQALVERARRLMESVRAVPAGGR